MSSKPQHNYLPQLDGIRTIAIGLVLIFHWLPTNHWVNTLPNGTIGVTLFFVLSGFLITYLLLLEQEKGGIIIRKFYIRRILRIWPVYYLYLFISLLFVYFIYNQVDLYSTLFYVFFAANIPFVFG